MKTLTLYLKITTLLLLIWMYQRFYNCDSYKTLIDKNILLTKNELIYERVLTEGDIAGKKQNNAGGCLEERPLGNKKNKCKNPAQYKNPCDQWHRVITPALWERFNKETIEMDPKWRNQKWNSEWNKISANKVNDLRSMSCRRDIPDEEKNKITDSIIKELESEFEKFLCECKQEMRDHKTESESKKEQGKNKIKNKESNIFKFLFSKFHNH
ncbi:fam-g protein [Plasmodium gallinaceum]|uniref:Fam-g protein n=1 Tax=Plasmodium gallinaceum TaxID=5849 RepID=A0A1J1GY67_PLAGA|nr:fam-g protein [Plasmodium gallinaceum]CRG97405.1 fam-g protein [Plasmodium gallinaceum]